jgi:hypothetical protein
MYGKITHILTDIYPDCLNVKEREEGRGRGMTLCQRNKGDCKGIDGKGEYMSGTVLSTFACF